MSRHKLMLSVAQVLRRHPWMVASARGVWKLTRPRFSMGVVGVVFNGDGHVLLVEHVFHPYLPWGLPGGWVERGEDPARSVRREIREELALHVEVGPVVAAKLIDNAHVDLAYLCYASGEIGSLSYELLDYRWVDPDDLPRTHPFHIVAIREALLLMEETRI